MKHIHVLLMLVVIFIFSACRKSDSEMKKALVGTWKFTSCPFAAPREDNDLFWFGGTVTFNSDMTFSQSALLSYCKNDCYTDTLWEGGSTVEHCTCQYDVEDGDLTIWPDGDNVHGFFGDGTNWPYRRRISIVKVTANRLVLDESEINGFRIECTCFQRN